MANWAWPHTPSDDWARIILGDGPFAGEQVGFLPPDTTPPVQIAWAAWFPGGFVAYLYAWNGRERVMERGRTSGLIYRCTGRRLTADEIPPLISEDAEVWATGAATIVSVTDVPAELIWPGV